jgi:glycosyltransferase 2 family protein
VSSTGQARVRRPSDVFTALVGLLLIIWVVLEIDSTAGWEQALIVLVQSSPQWVTALFGFGYALSLLYVLGLTAALITGGKERRPALRDLTIVAVGAAGLVALLSLVISDAWPYVIPEIGLDDPAPRFPVLRVALVTAVLLVVGPHVTRPLRRFGWFAIAATAVASVGLNFGTPSHTLGSFGIGLLSAGLLLIVEGSPRGYPDPAMVASALASLGTPVQSLEVAPYQTWGVIRFVGRDVEGEEVDIKVRGRDAYDAQLVAKLWHTLWYRETSRAVSYSALGAVEHEAVMTSMAERAGLHVPQIAAVGSASSEISLISFRGAGVPLPETPAPDISDDLLIDTWRQVRRLHERLMSHGSLSASAVHVGPDGNVITDFALGSLAAEEADQASDVVEFLFSLALLVGEERAVSTALQGLERDRLVAALPYLQVPAVSSATRHLAEKPKKVISALSGEVAEQAGVEVPQPVKLQRVTVKDLVTVALVILVVSALVPLFTSVDYAEIWTVLQSANWALLILALLVGHLQFIPNATATMFAVPVTLPFWPLLTLQTASQFVSLAVPSAAGRVAMNMAFLRKFGISVTEAVAQGSIDGFSAFLIQVVIMILAVVAGDLDLNLDIDTSEVQWLLILGVVVLVVIGVVVAVMKIQSLHDRVVHVVTEAWAALMVVLKQPSRALGLFGSNFVYWNTLGLTLWLILQAIGADIGYGSALFVAAGANLLVGIMPVPGGVGVAEATITALLVTLGVDESAAFAATIVFRAVTFYLPALEGFFGARWLEHHGYI